MKTPLLSTAILTMTCFLAGLPSSQGQGRLAELRKNADTNGDGIVSDSERREALRSRISDRITDRKGKGGSVTEPGNTYTDGAKCLFIGHSFFVPVAKSFDQIAKDTGFGNHQAQTVFSPGGRGTPGQLWNNPKNKSKIEAILATGEIEILGMTTAGPRQGSIDDYRNWIDLALKYNPNTQFMIGQAWMIGGTKLDDEEYARFTQSMGEKGYEHVSALRKEYPNKIHYNHYGYIGSQMKSAFHAGKLPDITTMVGKSEEALFTDDRLGHGGPLMHELCAITWAKTLYQADLDELSHSDFSPQAAAIANAGIKHNQQYR